MAKPYLIRFYQDKNEPNYAVNVWGSADEILNILGVLGATITKVEGKVLRVKTKGNLFEDVVKFTNEVDKQACLSFYPTNGTDLDKAKEQKHKVVIRLYSSDSSKGSMKLNEVNFANRICVSMLETFLKEKKLFRFRMTLNLFSEKYFLLDMLTEDDKEMVNKAIKQLIALDLYLSNFQQFFIKGSDEGQFVSDDNILKSVMESLELNSDS